jgi:tetratricopeptide (TPR) repeat protein
MMISERLNIFFGEVEKGLSGVKTGDIAKFAAKEAVGAIPVVGQIVKDAFDEFSPDEKEELIKEMKELSEIQFKEISENIGVSIEYLEDIQKFTLYTFKELRADHDEIKKLLFHLIETAERSVPKAQGGGSLKIGDTSGQIAIGEYIIQIQSNEKLSAGELIKLMEHLNQKREESANKEILDSYSPSALPDYPPRLKGFVIKNRLDDLNCALIYLQDHRIRLVSGVGGVGKTTLARALIETRPANVPLPFWFDCSMNMDVTLGYVLEKLASYMNAPHIADFKTEGREARQDDIDRLTDELQKREPVWLVFDNLETILDDRHFHDPGMDSLFTSLRNSTHQAKIIVTSRTLPILKDGESLIDTVEDEKQELKGLEIEFAIDYLIKNGLGEIEDKKLEELAGSVDGHPLALKLLVGVVKKFGVSDTLNDLSRYQRRKADVIKKTRRLFDRLAGDEKELLECVSVFRRPAPMSAIEAMFTARTSEDAVDKLIDKSLLETDHGGKYWLHPLVREFSYDDLEDKIGVHRHACQYYLDLPLPEKHTTREDVQPLIEAHHHACMAEEYDEAAGIIFDYNLHEDLHIWGNYRTLVDLYAGVLPKDHFRDEPLLGSLKTHSDVLGSLGLAYRDLGQVEKAIKYHEGALVIAREIGDRRNEGNQLGNLGIAYRNIGQVEKAIEYYEDALVIAREIGDRRGEGADLGNLGSAYYALGQVEKAIRCYEDALAIGKEIKDPRIIDFCEQNLESLKNPSN